MTNTQGVDERPTTTAETKPLNDSSSGGIDSPYKLPKTKGKFASPADTNAIMHHRCQAAAECMLQAATGTQPRCFCSGRRLPLAFNPGSAQLQQQQYSCPRLRPRQAFFLMKSAVVMAASSGDASKAGGANAPRVKAAFAEAGLSQDAIDYILTQYPTYLRWDVEQKLLPAMQHKQQELGARFPSEFRRIPKMLLRSTEVMAKARIALKAAKAKAASGNAASVQAAFAEAGLSQDAIDHILTQYPYYLRWDVGQKLLPAMSGWQQELGDRLPSEFKRIPTLLLWKPEKETEKDAYLTSIGVTSPKRLWQRRPIALLQPLISMQGRVAFLRARGFTQAQVASLIEQHPDIISRSSEHVEELLGITSDVFDCAQDMDALADVVLSCRSMAFCTVSPTALHHNFTYFCTCIGGNDKEMQRAWKHGVFRTSPAELDIRLDSIAAQLDTTLDQAKSLLRRIPEISSLVPATVALHVTQLHGLGFTCLQVKSMCLRQPSMLTLNYNSQLQADKWAFLTCVLQLSHDAIVAKPHLLMSSLPNRMGPRWEYLLQLRLHGVITFTGAHEVLNSLVSMTDSQFRATYTTPQLRVYDKHFQKQWQRRWNFLLVDQQVDIQVIADNPALLHISLKNT